MTNFVFAKLMKLSYIHFYFGSIFASFTKKPQIEMKKSSSIIMFILLNLFAFNGYSQNVSDDVVSAIKAGNSKMLAAYFGNAVEISLPDKDGTFSKAQAEMMMKDFFANHPPVSFIVNQKGASTGGSKFIIGTYKSGSVVYKVYLLLKASGQTFTLQQIQFEED